ncbi:MAG: PTS sugar transporter subunit IIA, partial [Pelagibacterales bacterium]|nr:PTS sugar transporter subunit IIA [Pelagibacterales bacterium]
MNLHDFLDKGSILLDYELKSKKSVLELISKSMAEITETSSDDIFSKLYEREKLGTTAFGNGIAIPHARI